MLDGEVTGKNEPTMSARELRRRAKQRIDGLSPERVSVALDFLAYLEEREANEATEELLRIPGFVEEFARAEREIAEGKLTPVEKLRRKY